MDAAAVLCSEARRLGVEGTIVFLHSEAGPPVLNVENRVGVTDDYRLNAGIGTSIWRNCPVFEMLRRRVEIIGSEVLDLRPHMPLASLLDHEGSPYCRFVVPLLGPSGWFATAVHGNATPFPIELERQLALRVTKLTVWCVERGIGRVPRVPTGPALPPRRYRIAQLAAEGQTNAEIAALLDISVNTVKAGLKRTFLQLRVGNRTELAGVMRRLAPVRDVPIGITRLGTVTVTRVEYPVGLERHA